MKRLMALGLGWIAVGVCLYLWLHGRETWTLRQELIGLQFYALEIGFVAVVALSVLVLPRLVRGFGDSGRTFFLLAGTTVLGLVLLTLVVERTPRIFFDEQIYLSIGQNLADEHKAWMCNEGTTEYGSVHCYRGEYNKQPYGYPYLLSLVFRLAGVGDWAGWFVNNLCFLLLPWTVYAASRLLFDDRGAALWAALLAVLIPEQLMWSNTSSSETSAALAVLASVVSALYFVRERSTAALAWTVATTAFALQFRPESILAVPLVAGILLLLAPRELPRTRMFAAALGGLVLSSVVLGHLVAVSGESWGVTDGPRMSASYFLSNLRTNGLFYFENVRFPALYTVLALFGVFRAWRRQVLVPIAHFLLFWGVFLFFYAGSYDYGADVRYSLMSYPPLAILAGRGLAGLLALVPQGRRTAASRAAVAFVAFNFLAFLPLVRAAGEEAWAARAGVEIARQFRDQLPANSIVLTHNPNMFLVWGANAAQASYAAYEESYVEDYLMSRYSGGVFFHWNYWCNAQVKEQADVCEQILDRFPAELVDERRVRDQRFALYRLAKTGAASPPVPPALPGDE